MLAGVIDAKRARLCRLFEEYYDRLAGYAYAHIHSKADADDIAGEVFARALEALDRFEETGIPMHAWLFTIARNLIIDFERKKANAYSVPIEDVDVESGSNPVTDTETKLELERVTEAFKHLTQEQQEVLRLRFFGELPSREVASLMEKSDGAVREMQREALGKLRLVLESTPCRRL